MKTLFALLVLSSTVFAQAGSPSPALTKAEILARAQALIAAQRAQATANAEAQKAARDAVKARETVDRNKLAGAFTISGNVEAIQPEGIRMWGSELWNGKSTSAPHSFFLVGYSGSVGYHQYLKVLGRPDGSITYPTVTGFQMTLPAYRFLAEAPKKVKDDGRIKDGVSLMKD